MTITIDLMNVVYFLIAYLVVGYFVMLALKIFSGSRIYSLSRKDRRKRIIKSFYWSALFSWAFPYAVISEAVDQMRTIKRERFQNSLDNSVFVNRESGERYSYKELVSEGYLDSLRFQTQFPKWFLNDFEVIPA